MIFSQRAIYLTERAVLRQCCANYYFLHFALHQSSSSFPWTDFDEDGVLGLGDLERTCRQLTRGGLSAEEVATVCRKILEESDIDGDGALSYLEFEHVVTRASDFMATFHIRIWTRSTSITYSRMLNGSDTTKLRASQIVKIESYYVQIYVIII